MSLTNEEYEREMAELKERYEKACEESIRLSKESIRISKESIRISNASIRKSIITIGISIAIIVFSMSTIAYKKYQKVSPEAPRTENSEKIENFPVLENKESDENSGIIFEKIVKMKIFPIDISSK